MFRNLRQLVPSVLSACYVYPCVSVTNNYGNVQQPAVLYPQQQQQIAPPMPLQFQPAGTQIPTASSAGNHIPPPDPRSQIPATLQEVSETKQEAPDS